MNANDMILERLTKIEINLEKLGDKIDKRITPLEFFKYKIVGICLCIATLLPIAIIYLDKVH